MFNFDYQADPYREIVKTNTYEIRGDDDSVRIDGRVEISKDKKTLKPYSISFMGRTWSLNGLNKALSNTMKVCVHLFANYISLIPLYVVSGKTGLILKNLGIIN